MSSLDALFDAAVFDLPQAQKAEMLLSAMNELTRHHHAECEPYRAVLDGYGLKPGEARNLEDLPFLPVRMFKRFALKSIAPENVFKTLTSSGTTGQTPSQIFLDTKTAQLQAKALVKVVQSFVGTQRLPMLILDHPSVVKDRRFFSARGAGILGLANFGRDHLYALDDTTMAPNIDAIEAWIEKHRGKPVLMFGFTFMAWKYFTLGLKAMGRKLALDNAILIHSGGWKKLQDEAVSSQVFRDTLREWAGVNRIHNFYGMVEQTGSVYVECEQGFLHAPVLSDLIVRNPHDWSVTPLGQEGVLQVLSALPHSYPGHSLMTEDIGVLHGIDDCPCGRKGKYFTVKGRVPMAEMRGCSDTHASLAA